MGTGFLIRDKHREGFIPVPNWVKRSMSFMYKIR